jgi:hypothetical protein
MYRRVLGELRSQGEKLRFLGYADGRPEEVYDLTADSEETLRLDPGSLAAARRLEEILRDFAAHDATPVRLVGDGDRVVAVAPAFLVPFVDEAFSGTGEGFLARIPLVLPKGAVEWSFPRRRQSVARRS